MQVSTQERQQLWSPRVGALTESQRGNTGAVALNSDKMILHDQGGSL